MGCIINQSPTPAETETFDLNDLFSVKKQSPSHIVYSNTTIPRVNKKTEEFISEISSLEENHQTITLILRLFDIVQIIDGRFPSTPIDIIKITQNDIESSQGRIQKKGGCYSFGNIENCRNRDSVENEMRLDYNLNNDNHVGPHQFDIIFDRSLIKFYVNDCKEGTGLFKKITEGCLIENGIIFNYCNNNSMKLIWDKINRGTLIIKFLEGEFKGQIITFNSEKYQKVRLGKLQSNEIVCYNSSASRIQWTIIYKNNSWLIYDGNYEDNNHQASTNGLWCLIKQTTEISDESIWKTGEKLFKAIIVTSP